MARILLIEDDESVRFVVGRILARDWHEILEAADGEAGLVAAAREQPDLVIVDMGLPGISGTDTIGELRRRDPRLPILAMSGWELDESGRSLADQAGAVGASASLGKPFDPFKLGFLVRSLVGPGARGRAADGG